MIEMSTRSYMLALIAIAVVLINADLNLLSPNLTQIADEFGFSQREKEKRLGGVISIGFFLIGAPSALLFGFLSDRFNRIYLLSFIIIFSETACLLTYFTDNYNQLLYCRVITGTGIGGSIPIIFSILGDLYAGESRMYISTIIGISMSAGIALGQLVSGLIGPIYGWRFPFLIISIPSLILALVILLTGKEPERGQEERKVESIKSSIRQIYQEGELYYQRESTLINSRTSNPIMECTAYQAGAAVAETAADSVVDRRIQDDIDIDIDIDDDIDRSEILRREILRSISDSQEEEIVMEENTLRYDEKINLQKLKRLLSTPSVVIIILQGIPGCIPWGVIYVFLNDFLIQNSRFSHEVAAVSLFLFGVGGIIGQLIGGYFGQHLYNRDKRIPCFIMGFTTAISIPILQSILKLSYYQVAELQTASFFGGFFCSITGPIVRSMLQNVCIPEVRGSAFAVFTLTDDLGKGFGPVIIVQILTLYSTQDRSSAFAIIFQFWIICAVLLLGLIFTITKDVSYVEEQIRSNFLRSSSRNCNSDYSDSETAVRDENSSNNNSNSNNIGNISSSNNNSGISNTCHFGGSYAQSPLHLRHSTNPYTPIN